MEDFFRFFRNIFKPTNRDSSSSGDGIVNDFRKPIWDTDDGTDSDDDFRRGSAGWGNNGGLFSFNVYSNPLEIHRYFEHQVDQMMRNFFSADPFNGSQGFFSFSDSPFRGFPLIDGGGPDGVLPALPPPPISPNDGEPPQGGSLRESLLKPDFRKGKNNPNSKKEDVIIDGREPGASELIRRFGEEGGSGFEHPNMLEPESGGMIMDRHIGGNPWSGFFSATMRRESFTMQPDGTYTRETVQVGPDGTETRTVARVMGNKEYVTTTTRDSSGNQHVVDSVNDVDPNTTVRRPGGFFFN